MTNSKQWYEELFENYAETYDKETYTQGTLGETDFIEKEINYDKSKTILDIGCGTGRHTIELAKRGYRVVGIDFSESQLKRAREKAEKAQISATFVQKDARMPHFSNEFDLAIMLCEGGFSLMETDEMNYKILENAARALKPNGKLIFSALNGLFPLHHNLKDFHNENTNESFTDDCSFDLMTLRSFLTIDIVDDLGNKKKLRCNERSYLPSEISWYLKALGFKTIDIFGCKLGAFSRNDKLTIEDFELLVIAEKQ
jgi:ubiquinone/menaquinone biosynthesis C-methylase UbiE